MRNARRLLALVLAFVLVLGLLPAAAAQTVHTHGVEEYPELQLNVETTVTVNPGKTVYFRFTPEVTAEYTFKSLNSHEPDPQGYLYDADMNLLASHQDNNYIDFNFTIVYTLEAGKTYVYACHLYDAYKLRDVTFLLTGVMPPEHNYVGVVTKEPTCTEDGEMTYTCTDCGISYTEVIPAGHDFVDGFCTRCGEEQIFTGVCGDNLTWTLGANGTLTVSGSGDMYNYLPYEPMAPWADHAANIKNVVIEDTAVSIGEFAFYNCTALQTVSLPDSLNSLGNSAFRGCSALTTVTGGENVATINAFAYMDCAQLTDVTLTGAKTIGNSAFYNCDALESVEFSDSLTTVDTMAFSECTGLKAVSLPNTVTEMGTDVFSGCSALTTAKLSHGLDIVPKNTFAYCTSLTDVTLPMYMYGVDNGAFFGCTSLEKLAMPFSTTLIGDDAFGNCTALSDFDLPMAVTYVGFFAFYNCTSLTEINFPAGLTYFTGGSFSGCTGLTEITFPAGTIQVDDQAFEFCTNLKTITFTGDAPAILFAFEGVVADAYYPAGNSTWTSDLLLNYGGHLTWHAQCSKHQFGKWTPIQPSTCVEHGVEERKCDLCGWTETRQIETLAPHSWDNGVEHNGMMLYTCTVCGATELREIAGPVNPFTDVAEKDFFYDAVLWAVKEDITTGTSDTTFSPDADCNRAAVVTFLWRAAGSPEPKTTQHPFVDVKAGSFYEKAVLWAVEMGVTNGTDATHFSPDASCNRAQVVTFLYRAMGNPDFTATECPFSDVVAGQWYEAPILWAVENGITNGMGDGIFGVDTTCNRAQVVTFLYRTYNP